MNICDDIKMDVVYVSYNASSENMGLHSLVVEFVTYNDPWSRIAPVWPVATSRYLDDAESHTLYIYSDHEIDQMLDE